MSFSYEDFYLSGFNTGTTISGIQKNTPLYWIVTGLKYNSNPVTTGHFAWFTGITIASSGTLTEQSGYLGFDVEGDVYRGILTFNEPSGLTATGCIELYWNSGGLVHEAYALEGTFYTFSNKAQDAINQITILNDSVDNADSQHSHAGSATHLYDLDDVNLPGTIDDGDVLIYESTSGGWTTGQGGLIEHTHTGYETVSGDYLITSGTVDDYAYVSGRYALTSGSEIHAIHDNIGAEINGIATEKNPSQPNDLLLVEDSTVSYQKQKMKISSIRITESQITDFNSTGILLVSGSYKTLSGSYVPASGAWEAARHIRLHHMTGTLDHTGSAWMVYYNNEDGDITELAIGTSGYALCSQGTSVAPIWSPAGEGSPNIENIIHPDHQNGVLGFVIGIHPATNAPVWSVLFSDNNAGVSFGFYVKDGGTFTVRIIHSGGSDNSGKTAGGNIDVSYRTSSETLAKDISAQAWDLSLGNTWVLLYSDYGSTITVSDGDYVSVYWYKDDTAESAAGTMYIHDCILIRN